MRINEPLRIGKCIELDRHNRMIGDTVGEPTLTLSWGGSGMSLRLTDEDREALIEALRDPSAWPLRYEIEGGNTA